MTLATLINRKVRQLRVKARLGRAMVTVAFCLLACEGQSRRALLSLSPCHLADVGGGERVAAECGRLTVPENRDLASGRSIELFVAVLRATGSPVAEDPLFLIAGGPGGSISREFPPIASLFGRINVRRDLVLVDQRGTGRSHPLVCPTRASRLDESAPELAERLRRCLADLDADPRQYGTPPALADLDAVRAALGYERINLYGGSYGTRVALAYARAYPSRLRSMVLDGVVPFGSPIGAHVAHDAQRALDGLFARCAADAICQKAFPDLPGDLGHLMARFEQPQSIPLVHPTTGEPTLAPLSRRVVAGSIRMLSYASETASLLPLLIRSGAMGNLQPLAAQAFLVEQLLSLSEGMHFSVICSEDFPFIRAEEAHDTYLGRQFANDYAVACSQWPRTEPSPEFLAPVHSNAPTLLLSGELDPVTPPANAELARSTLSQVRHLVLPGEAHGVFHRGCTAQLVSTFLDRLEPHQLDASCLDGHRPLPFFTSFRGPQP